MKIKAQTRQLATPQKTATGKVRTNISGQAVYTEYLVLSSTEELKLRMHMRKTIDTLLEAVKLVDRMQFAQAVGFNPLTKKQIDNEPRKYSWDERLKVVDERINDKGKNLTKGIIDMFNSVVGSFYRGIEASNEKIERKRVELVSTNTSQRPLANPDVFENLFDRGENK